MRKVKKLIRRISFKIINGVRKRYFYIVAKKKLISQDIINIETNYFDRNIIKNQYYTSSKQKVGFISDRKFYENFKNTCEAVCLEPQTWKDEIKELDLLIITTIRRGFFNPWGEKSEKSILPIDQVHTALDVAKGNDIPVLFYSLGEVRHTHYWKIAKKADYIVTLEKGEAQHYKQVSENIYTQEYGFDSHVFNPISAFQDKNDNILFGSTEKLIQPQGLRTLQKTLETLANSGKQFNILDTEFQENKVYLNMSKYLKNIYNSVEEKYLGEVYKKHGFIYKFNAMVHGVPVYSGDSGGAIACGTSVVANYNVAQNQYLPYIQNLVCLDDMKYTLVAREKEELYEYRIHALRHVLRKHTSYECMNELLYIVGLGEKMVEPKVLVVCDDINAKIIEQFQSQTIENKTLINHLELTEEIYKEHDYIVMWSSDCSYGVFYLEDMVNAFKYAPVSYSTKTSYFKNDELIGTNEHNFTDRMGLKASTLFKVSDYTLEQIREYKDYDAIPNGYSIDSFNFNQPKRLAQGDRAYKLAVVIPIYNNGEFLLSKAFNSIAKSTMFQDIQVVLVDDGSTDGYTPKVTKYLEDSYGNVTVYRFPVGGSGSASRPRNKGLELVTAPYIAYLDPDDESVNDGFTKLYERIIVEEADIVVGGYFNVSRTQDLVNYGRRVKKSYGSLTVLNDSRNFILKSDFHPYRLHTMLIDVNLLRENNLMQTVGAAGQDSLLSLEMFLNAKKIVISSEVVHVYYSAIEGSIVNSVNVNFFRKYEKNECTRIVVLEKHNLTTEYMANRFQYYFVSWYIKHLVCVKNDQLLEAAEVLYEIFEKYEAHYDYTNETINEFVRVMRSENKMLRIVEFVNNQGE